MKMIKFSLLKIYYFSKKYYWKYTISQKSIIFKYKYFIIKYIQQIYTLKIYYSIINL